MAIWHINGGNRLDGVCFVQGSKNAVLPMLAASVICGNETELLNVPQITDVSASLRILRQLGCVAEQQDNDVYIDSSGLTSYIIPCDMMKCMRSSILFMGALLARCGEVQISVPGGCRLGKRPIDLHLGVMRELGAEIEQHDDVIVCRCDKLLGTRLVLPFRSVGATENAMLAACGAEGETEIIGAALEPEIVDLQEFLRKLGAYISGAGTDRITIRGFSAEPHVGHRIMPDRIVASTILCATAAAGGNVDIRGVDPLHFSQIQHFLNSSGCDIMITNRSVHVRSDGKLKGIGEICTAPYPGFPTDAQPLLMAALLKSEGGTVFQENIFENRFAHVREFKRFGADVEVDGDRASLWGVDSLKGAAVTAADLRGGAALIIAGLCAEGKTEVYDNGYICRGYDGLDCKLRMLGADVDMEI